MAAEEDAVKVCVRVRPIIQRERGDQVNVFWKAENSTISQIDGTRSFHFDRVFDLFETTAQVYQEVAIPIIRSALHGYNGTIFAYGQTSSGKTYTMMGSPDCLGIIPQAVKEIFRIITEIPSREFLLRVSYMEIYNETVTDLLCDSRKKKPLEIREDFNRNVYVADLNEELVTCPEHVLQWIKKGEKNRHYGETKMNEHSSRSHTIFRMIVESRKSNDPGNLESSDGAVMVSHLNLVDLAGSERTSQTGAEGVRLKEGCNINRSLFILGQVIKKLSDDQPGAFINYRDSKLTRILQNSLGGNTKTVIICTITSVSFDETLSTLQFASAAKNVKNKPHVNEVLDDEALLKRYRKEITDLKKQLDTLEASSVSKAHAMANEEHAQLLAVIQQLQKEREERISNLKNVVVDSARSQEDQQLKRKRRVTWGAEKIQSTLYSAGAFPFEAGSKISANFPKRPKLSDLQTIPENDDSVCTEFSETDETARVFEDFFPDWDVGNKITLREKTAFRHSMIDLDSDAEFQNSPLLKDCSSPNHKQLEQKLAELDNRLQSEVIRKESFEKETLELKKQLEAKEEEKDELVKKLELEITTLKDQLKNMPEVRVRLGSHNELEDLDSKNLTPSQVEMYNSQSTQTDQVQENCVEEEENLSSHIHDICQEQIQMLEQKIADLETSNPQTDFVESLQICEALMMEKETALSELAILRENFDSVVVENESMKQEIATMEKYLQEKNETSEFELLEKETQKEHEGELENKSNVLKEQEKLIAELKKDAEVLLNKSRYSDLSISMGGDSEKIFEEVLQLKQSLGDAETVTRDAQREAAFLRSENIELKEKMDELTLHCQQREKDASSSEKQLESEKSNYKQMQSDLQKELQCAFNEINQLNGLLAGRVPKDLLSRVELDKKIADCSKQLTNALEEKNVLEKEMSYLSELKSLPSENEQLKNQVKKTSDELQLLKNEKEQSESIICDQNSKMQEQKEQIDRLIEEVRNTQAKFHQAEQQFSELTILYEDLQTRCLLTDEEIRKKDLEAEGQVKEINDLKHSLEIIEGKLSSAQQEREEFVQAQKDHSSHTSSIEETLKSMVFERDNLQEELSNLSSLVETLQQQAQKQSELLKEKQDLEQKHLQLMSEKEQLQEQLNNSQLLPSIMETERSEGQLKLQELQEKITLLDRQRDDLQSKVEELTSEKNILKQDLNDNIEMSIETQDELRTTQEELKCQKQLVSDLKKQISDYAERISVQAVSYEDTTEASEANSDAIGVKKMELDEYNQSLISEMEVLKESLKSAELALATMEEEKCELMQKLDALEEDLQSVTAQRDELENAKNNLLVEKDGLKAKVERAAIQVCELNEELKFSPEKRSHEDVMGQEKEKLLETLKAVTDERDQLKLDLHDNIEMSIETQEELRNALDELKEKSRLFEALKSQVDGSKGQTSNLEKNLEVKILDLEEKLHAAVTERDHLSEELRFLTEQKRNLEEALSATKHGLLDKETQDKVQVLTEVLVDEEEMNVSTRLEVEAEQNILKEQIDHLQQQIHIISEEREQYLQLIDTLKAENLQLVSVMQRQTEDMAAQIKETEDLSSLIETLKGQLEATSQQLTLREQEAKEAAEKLMQLNDADKNISGLEMLERNLQQSSISMEKLQEEKCELSDKLCALQEELEKVTCYRENLQSKLEIVLDENASLKEVTETASSSVCHKDKETQDKEVQVLTEVLVDEEEMNVSTRLEVEAEQNILQERIDHLQQQIHIISEEREQYLQLIDTLKAENLQLVSVMQRQTEDRAAQSKETEDLASLIETLKGQLENTSQQLTLREQEAKEAAEKLRELNDPDKNISELEMLEQNLQQSSISMEKLQGEKLELSDKLCVLQEKLEKMTCYRENLQSKLEIVLDENASLKEIIETASSSSFTTREVRCQELQDQGNVEKDLGMQIPGSVIPRHADPSVRDKDTITNLMPFLEGQADLEEQLLQKTSEYEQLLQLKDKLEEDQNSLSCKVEGLTNRMTEAQTNLESLQNEKHQSEEQLLHLQQKLDDAVQDRDDIKIAHERLIDEMDQLKKNIKEKSEMDLCLQEQLLQRTSEYEQLLKMKNKLEEENSSLNCEVESLTNKMTEAKKIFDSMQNEKHETEEQLVDLKQKLNFSVQDGDDLKIAQEGLIAEIELLKRNLKENDEMVLHLKQEIQQRTECQHEALEQTQHTLKNAFEQTMNDLKSTETQMEALRSEKLDTEKKLLCLQHTMEIIAQERDDLKASQENLILERDQLKEALEKNTEMLKTVGNQQEQTEVAAQTETLKNSELDQLLKDLNDMESQLASVQREKVNAEENVFTLQKHMEEIGKERDELQATLQSLQLILQSLQAEKDQLKDDMRENIEMLKTVGDQQEQTEVAAQTETLKNSEFNQLLKDLKDMESQLASVQREKVNAEEKFSSLQKHMEEIGKERDELQATLQSLQSEKDQLKEDLSEQIEMSIETQEDLRSTQEELKQQIDMVSELTREISFLEQKSSLMETELSETATVLKKVTSERDDLDQCKQKLTSKVEQLSQQIKDKEVALYQAEKEKSEVSQKVFDLSSVLSSMAEEKGLLNCSKEDVEKQSVEMQNDLRRTQEELQQQNHKVETLTSEISLLEEKCSSLQKQLQEHVTLLERAVEEKEVLDQAKQKLSSDIEQLLESLKSKDAMLELTEAEKRIAAQKVIELTEEVRNLSCQIEDLQLFKENLEKEATKLREDFKQLQLQHAKFNEQETQKSARLEELTLEVEQLKEKVTFKEAAAQQFETDKSDLHRKVQQYELEVASLHQEQEQFQQLLQRVRDEKENIYTNLQDREKDNEHLKESLTTCQTELESVKKQRDESKDHVTEKVNEINAMLQQLSSLQQQLQQLHQELKNERMKNNDLNEKVDDLEKEIRVLHLLQNEPVLEEEDELAQRTESLQIKNQEFKDLMVTISSVYANQHHLLSNLSVELQDEVEAQKQSLGAIKEAMPSTHFKSLESLQTEYFKLNSQMQTLLNKFKVIYRNATVKEEQYSLVNGYDNELCVVQKKNDELQLQCQSLEQNGTKWSESAAEELKFCELEFLNHLIFKKMDVIKRVEDGFSEVQISLNSVEGDLTEEVKSKKKFSSWLEECKGLHFDAKCFSEGIIQENRRISGLVQLLSKKLKAIVQSRIKQDTVAYLKQLDEVLQEKKEKNKELLQKRQLFAPSGDSNILEEENARLCEKLKNLQAELKKMQCRIQQLENEVTSAKADAKQKGEKASRLQERLLSSVTEAALSEMQAKVSEKEKHLETALKEIKALQEKVAQGAAPYRDEMDRLKNQVVKFEMDRIKLSKSTDQQIASLKSSLEYKEECLRKSKEQLRRSQKDVDTTICSDKNGSIPYPLTCGGGSGIVQSTTMLVLQSENASLKREIAHYRKKWNRLSRNASTIREDESKLKDRSAQTPLNLFSPLGDSSQSSSEAYKQATVSPPKSDIPLSHIHSPGMHRKRAVSPSRVHKPKPQVMSPSRTHIAKPQVMSPNKTPLPKSQVMSPNKTSRHSVPASSPGKTGPNRKRAVSPFRTEGQLFSNLTESPRKKLSLPESADLPKDKLFEWSKSLQYCPSKFFDNSTLGTLPDAESDPNSAIATETNEVNNWWDRADKNKNANECKTS